MKDGFIPTHGGYKRLLSYQKAEIVYDATVYFCDRFIDRRSRTHDQMIQAARSGKQNIIEGSMASATSKETEIKLTNVARASLEELLADYGDFLRVRGFRLWEKNSKEALYVRKLGARGHGSHESHVTHATYETYRSIIETQIPSRSWRSTTLDRRRPWGCAPSGNFPTRLPTRGRAVSDGAASRPLTA